MHFTRPENQLLIYAARLSLDEAATEQVRQLLHADLDWDYLRSQADRHNLLPLLHQHLSDFQDLVPAAVMAQLRSDVGNITRRSIYLTGELLKLLEILEANKLDAVPFKGPTLAAIAYGDVGLREFADLDILVRKDDLARVMELLSDNGLQPTPALTTSQQAALRRFECAHNFGDEGKVLFDVHWNFAAPYSSFKLPVDRIWERRQRVSIGGRQLLTLSSEDLLLVLCLHGATHFWERLGWIADVAALISREENLNWQQVIADAAKPGNKRMLWLGLSLANKLLAAPLPDRVLKEIQTDAIVQKLTDDAIQIIAGDEPAPTGLVNEIRFQLRLKERPLDKFTAGIRLAATPRGYDWMQLPFPEPLTFLHYFWRPLRLAGKYGAKLFNGSSSPR